MMIVGPIIAVILSAATTADNPQTYYETHHCRVASESKATPYKAVLVCDAECNYVPGPPSWDEEIAAGINPKIATAAHSVEIRYRGPRCAHEPKLRPMN